jgi:hypothetical protein
MTSTKKFILTARKTKSLVRFALSDFTNKKSCFKLFNFMPTFNLPMISYDLSLILISSFRISMQFDNVCKMKMQSMSQATSRLAGRMT